MFIMYGISTTDFFVMKHFTHNFYKSVNMNVTDL